MVTDECLRCPGSIFKKATSPGQFVGRVFSYLTSSDSAMGGSSGTNGTSQSLQIVYPGPQVPRIKPDWRARMREGALARLLSESHALSGLRSYDDEPVRYAIDREV